MKEDKLERFIKGNRDSFDKDEPSKDLWPKIKEQAGIKSSPSQKGIWLWRAAALIFFASSLFLYLDKNNQSPELIAQDSAMDTTEFITESEEFKRIESYYLDLIENKKDLVQKISTKQIEPNPAVDLDLRRLDAMYKVLKDEYDRNPTSGVREALMLNLLIRTDILNDELARIEQLSDQQNDDGIIG